MPWCDVDHLHSRTCARVKSKLKQTYLCPTRPIAHNPPSLSRLDYMDALGMLALDENRDYGGNHGQGGMTDESVDQELVDMAAMVQRDRSHPSVIWWSFCNVSVCPSVQMCSFGPTLRPSIVQCL